MAATKTITVSINWPWWRDLFIKGVVLWAWIGLPVDPDAAARFPAGRAKIRVG